MKASVAYEAPKSRKKSKLEWKIQPTRNGRDYVAKGARGVYIIKKQAPARRIGVYRWALFMGRWEHGRRMPDEPVMADGKAVSMDDLAGLKVYAVRYDATASESAAQEGSTHEASDRYKKEVHEALVRMGRPNPDVDIAGSGKYLDGAEKAKVPPVIAASIISATLHHGHPKHAEFAMAKEAPTREEWEVIITNPPAAHRGAILSMVGPGEADDVGNKIILRGFHDDSEASNVATAIAKRYKSQVTFGPRNALYEAAEERLTTEQRANLPPSAFALPERRELPINDAVHVRNAPARLEMMRHEHHVTHAEYEEAKHRILKASRHFGIESKYEANEEAHRQTEIDEHALHELELYADNTVELYPQKQAIIANLSKKMVKGVYEEEKAAKLWALWVDAAAKRYIKEFGGSMTQFPPVLRHALAHKIEKEERVEMLPHKHSDVTPYGSKTPHPLV